MTIIYIRAITYFANHELKPKLNTKKYLQIKRQGNFQTKQISTSTIYTVQIQTETTLERTRTNLLRKNQKGKQTRKASVVMNKSVPEHITNRN